MERAGRLIGKLKLNVDDPELRARSAWKVAAGKKIAEHTRAVALVRGSLVVEVEDQIWQRQLNTLSGFLVRNLEKALGEALVTDIDFRPMPRRREPQRAVRARGAEDVQDPVLDMLYRQSRKKG
jgi:predicted nucleic acid-binding Zn ribbon protein